MCAVVVVHWLATTRKLTDGAGVVVGGDDLSILQHSAHC